MSADIIRDIFKTMTPPKTTHCFEIMRIVKARLAGKQPFADTLFEVEDIHFTASALTGSLTDPYDGQRYRITIEPVKS